MTPDQFADLMSLLDGIVSVLNMGIPAVIGSVLALVVSVTWRG